MTNTTEKANVFNYKLNNYINAIFTLNFISFYTPPVIISKFRIV